jgi:hypothetical protein
MNPYRQDVHVVIFGSRAVFADEVALDGNGGLKMAVAATDHHLFAVNPTGSMYVA